MSRNSLVPKISDFLTNYSRANRFGTCKRCSKNVYWSTVKVASHIRSGHCKGASEAEVSRFKHIYSLQQELVYEIPSHLSHISYVGKTTRSANESNKSTENGENSKQVSVNNVFIKQEPKDKRKSLVKRKKQDSESEDTEDSTEDHNETDDPTYATSDDGKVEDTLFVANDPIQETRSKKSVVAGSNKEDKFIATIYPEFNGKSKMELIDDILDLKRQIELLNIKINKYEETISKLL